MNHRVLVSGAVRLDDPARARVVAALSEITGQVPELYEQRLNAETPWLLDLPNEAEARRLVDWTHAASGWRLFVTPSVGAPAPSRAAGLAFLEDRLRTERETESAPSPNATDVDPQVRRQAEAKEKARVLAQDRAEAARKVIQGAQVGARGSGNVIELEGRRPPGSPLTPAESIERPHRELGLRPERHVMIRAILVVVVLLLLVVLLAAPIAGPIERSRLQDALSAGLVAQAESPQIEARLLKQDVSRIIRERGFAPGRFAIDVFIAEDRLAVGLEADRGLPMRTPEDGLRLRARAKGEGRLFLRSYSVDVYVDVLIPSSRVKGKVEPYWEDFIRLDVL